MHANWTRHLRFIQRHLTVLLLTLVGILFQSQVAIASHNCALVVPGESVVMQHMGHLQQQVMATPLCEKHCVPDSAQQSNDHPPVIALPVSMTLAVVERPCQVASRDDGYLTPPAMGPPATIRFCRFRE